MHTIDTRALLSRLDSARAGADRPVIATDADGTLWSGDVGVDAFEALLAARAVREEALARLRDVSREFGLPSHGDATQLAMGLYDAARSGAFPEDRCYELMAWSFAGYPMEQAKRLVGEVQQRAGLEARLHGEMKSVLSWARDNGVRVVVVSASPRFVVESAVAPLGIEPADVVGTTPEVTGGVIGAGLAEPMPYGERKAEVLLETAPQAQVLAAFGDSPFDLPMLRTAQVPVAVRPKASLREAIDGLLGAVELAREM